jgi:hypothetical protein
MRLGAAEPPDAVDAMFSVVSRRKHTFNAAACSRVRGGDKRVFTVPGRGALAMTVSAQTPALDSSSAWLQLPGLRIFSIPPDYPTLFLVQSRTGHRLRKNRPLSVVLLQ